MDHPCRPGNQIPARKRHRIAIDGDKSTAGKANDVYVEVSGVFVDSRALRESKVGNDEATSSQQNRNSTPTDPVLGSGCQLVFCTVPLPPTLVPYATVRYRASLPSLPQVRSWPRSDGGRTTTIAFSGPVARNGLRRTRIFHRLAADGST